jgi:hypothetical protein
VVGRRQDRELGSEESKAMRNGLLEYATGESCSMFSFMFGGLHYKEVLVTLRGLGLGRKIRAALRACCATWSSRTDSGFPVGPRKTTGNLDRIGRLRALRRYRPNSV